MILDIKIQDRDLYPSLVQLQFQFSHKSDDESHPSVHIDYDFW